MTDQEINEAVARKLGWEEGPGDQWRRDVFDMPKHGLPDYCRSMTAACEILNRHSSIKAGDRTYQFILVWHAAGWVAGWADMSEAHNRIYGTEICTAWDPEIPKAICLAFLKLKEAMP